MKTTGLLIKSIKDEINMNMETTNTTKSVKEDIVKDSIITDYLKYIQYLENHNYVRESVTIHENLSMIVTINNLKANNEGIVIDILCPPGILVSIPGIKSYPENYHIEKIPPFEIKLANSNGEEIGPETKINIMKNKILRKSVDIWHMSYKDVGMLNYSDSPNKFKYYNELFRFKNGIELKGEDRLKLMVINPDKDIYMVKFNLGTDLWTPI